MAGKAKSVYICSECGYESPKWFGCCPGCGEWNTMNEEIKAPVAAAAKSSASETHIGASARKRPVFRERSHAAKKSAYTSASQPRKSGLRT